MKSLLYKTPYKSYNSSNSIFALCTKPIFLFLFVSLIHNVAIARAMSSFANPGNETDRLALLAIKSQLKHPDGGLSSWNNSVHHCLWEGITCGRKHYRVTKLDLHSRNISGTISPLIGNLTFLRMIYLYRNSLYGHIPSTIGNLVRLEQLALSHNTLIGEIPANLSSCINLVFINMDYNKLEGKIPVGFTKLSKLEQFGVDDNKLTGPLFDIIQNLTSLQVIHTMYNSFTGTIPNSIGRMQNLIDFSVAENNLHGTIPASLFNLSSLQNLTVAFNQLNGKLPKQMGFSVSRLTWLNFAENNFSGSIPLIANFTNLVHIDFYDNSFTGKIAIDFGQFYNLQSLDLSGNHLEGDISIISSLTNCTKLYLLILATNHFSGVLPKSVANLSSLVYLSTGNNSITSEAFPIGITNLINLRYLDMNNNKLTSSIPHDIGKLHNLENLFLDSNMLTGKIPDSLENMSRLSNLYLANNRLEGSIPLGIGNFPSLLYLYLSHNELNGTLEKQLFTGQATFLTLDVSSNNLEGPLPLEISKKTDLVELALANNKFSGLLPDGLSECSELQYLYMEENSFNGNIPSSFASLTSLKEINLSKNNFSGLIPTFFSRISSIYYLDLSYNDFQGRVPTNSVFANATAINVVGNTRLCGGIQEIHLRKCIENKNTLGKKRTMSHTLKLIISVISAIVGVLAIVTGIYLVCIRKKKTPLPADSVTGERFMKVSYDMLLKATGGFSSESLLGSGSFGSVFKGILDGKTIAVKVLNLQHHDASKSFMAECKALRNVRHRNLVGIVTACSSTDFQRNDFKALVYEFMPNGSLDKWVNGVNGNLSLPQRIDVAIDVAHALDYLHHEGETPIVHCDLKPSNILLDQDMVAHVGDFGIARFLSQPRHPNQSSTIGIMGTIGYAASEYGLGSEASTAGDVYSYGILLLELITGKSPTDSMFKEDYNLHMYAQEALPDQVLQIVDPTLEEDSLAEEADDTRAVQGAPERKVECIISVLNVGVLCSNHLPQDRMKISDAISRLQAARKTLLNAKKRRTLPGRGE